jgi:hypothetical protein
MQVGRLFMLEGFESKRSYFEGDSLLNRKPMEFFKSRCYMVMSFYKWHNNTS